ncbi:M16 family metallopeptidase [Sphingomicrobium astaxanthinifaciens]|uniref:M16 family metallopeptidase n=1 Tax=Sphingomicrobium astaxanthinifaciens TaxID=1227949 RepID=UPI001FCB7B3E|nr:pitrilysin family protein [Sphingomicrobium astaxanthinifaciens]MCJ7421775.1 insulinase family protein [Sphingomicrobium astaxanthinifaciens]
MFRAKFLAGAAAMALALPLAGAPAPAQAQDAGTGDSASAAAALSVPPIAFERWTLDNGLTVIAIEDDTTPDVYVSMWYDVGSKHDPAGRGGFAHLFEHILSRKTENITFSSIAKYVDDVGGSRNASTWLDRTNYYETVPAAHLEPILWTHAERMARPVIDEDVFKAERDIVQEEYRQRYASPPYGRQLLALNENLYSASPYRRPTIGNIEELQSATLEDARAFFEAYYGPDTATLIVAGNFDEAELRAQVEKYFSDIPRRANPVSLEIETLPQPLTESRTVTVTAPNVPLPKVAYAWQLPPTRSRDMAAVDLITTILSGGDNNRLDPALVRTGLAVGAGTFANDLEEGGFMVVDATAASGTDPDRLAQALDAVLARFIAEGPTEAEMTEARNTILSNRLRGRETATGRANEIGEALVRSGEPDQANKRLEQVLSTSAADVQRVAREIMRPDARIELRYVKGDGDNDVWANPAPGPVLKTPPPATQPLRQVKAEGERMPWPTPAADVEVPVTQLERARLSNGIEVLAGQTSEVPVGTLIIAFEGGALVDPAAKAGRAALAASLAEKGTATRSEEEIAARLEALGAQVGASSAADGSYLFVLAPVANLEAAAMIAADLVKNATYPQAVFERERKRALDGLRVAMNNPAGLGGMLVAPLIFGAGSPYAVPTSGTVGSLEAMRREDLVAYREAYWRPENATIIASGGLSAERATAIAEAAFGDWSVEGPGGEIVTEVATEMQPRRTLVVDMPGVGQAAVFAVARGVTASDPRLDAMQLVNAELGGSGTARLFDEVRNKRALSYGAYSGISTYTHDGLITARSQTKNESAAEVAKLLVEEMDKVGEGHYTEEVLEPRRALLAGRADRSLQTSLGFAATVATAVGEGVEPERALSYGNRVRVVPAERAGAMYGAFLEPERVSVVIVGDASAFIDELREWRPDVEVVAAGEVDLDTMLAR